MSERVGCKHCKFKGYVKHTFFGGAKGDDEIVNVSICSHCKDSRGYYAYVRNKYGTQKNKNIKLVEEKEPLAKVLDFNEFKQRKKNGE